MRTWVAQRAPQRVFSYEKELRKGNKNTVITNYLALLFFWQWRLARNETPKKKILCTDSLYIYERFTARFLMEKL